jgi:erythromycin esterase
MAVLSCTAAVSVLSAGGQDRRPLTQGVSFEEAIAAGEAKTYSVALRSGDTVLLLLRQVGVDLVIDVMDPSGRVIDSVDSPTGRTGDEVVEIQATAAGTYLFRIRPYDDKEPGGRYVVSYVSRKNRAQSIRSTQNAIDWLGRRSLALEQTVALGFPQEKLRAALKGARVVGLGEATHGSREFGDLRSSLTKILIEQSGFRIVAVEASESRLAALAPFINGEVGDGPEVRQRIERGWIGRRSFHQLIEWARQWNAKHPLDRLRIVGIDAQENEDARRVLGRFLERAYGERGAQRWKEADAELTAADEQAAVFGDSGVNAETKQFLLEVNAMLDVDASLLRARYGDGFETAREAARTLLEFADFNSNGEGAVISHSRDHYMAGRILRSLEEAGTGAKAVYWAHNSHVVHPKDSTRSAGGVLRDVLGCGYFAVAATFGQGAFVAQIPNDREDRLAISTLPAAPVGSIEDLFAKSGDRARLTIWGCEAQSTETPDWFAIPRKMHWVGGLYSPGTNPAAAFRPFTMVTDFDGIVYLPRVTAEDIPTDRPLIPRRKR